MYYVEYSNNGWAIYYDGEFVKRKFIANQLSKKQAYKWCKRLNEAYREGFADGSY